ncbi:protein SODIUM POTASSIUM ROOT DEFECTIVE 2 [Sorghum bicolor]|uniref:HMA domain-containing protein n=1 Tax=Sorghum bicolor TaxID=4558 RepID=A0A1B6PHG4_SORBI|nr:protein SODIUM POTASSIUM ROOT DEFECTIVE 2 [Sorghum bicolor]KXG25122.1 hypothetical protein SORBI_3007G123400 [Sorghum bicolor]|eukprot:XP_021319865.1 protein SODIUM POTASSIUM ROOT DEFECTIVE 2 [Sorghum bicolor]
MRAGGMLCRSQAATAVCVPGDARSMVVSRRADRTIVADDDARRALHDVRYARLGGGGGDGGRRSTSRRFAAARAAAPPPPPSASASCKPRVERQQRRPATRAPVAVAVTLPMVTKSPSKEAPPKDLAAAAKRVQAAVAAAPGDQLLQVVVMKVAIHCQGCAGKVRKHISKMEGVTSFSIDLESKKVTVMGHVSPAGVLESISKVKKAELLA